MLIRVKTFQNLLNNIESFFKDDFLANMYLLINNTAY